MMNIKTLRDKYGLTQAGLSEITNIPKRTIENWESGVRQPSDYILNLVETKIEKHFDEKEKKRMKSVEIPDKSKENKRDAYNTVENFINSNVCNDGIILILYGLRRTGKTTIMEQVMINHADKSDISYYVAEEGDTMNMLENAIEEDSKKGKTIFFIDEATKIEDFLLHASTLPDIYAKRGLKIILSGTDSLSFVFADRKELFDRTVWVPTTYIPFEEHMRVLETKDIDDYIEYGGLMRKDDSAEAEYKRIIYDYESAVRYLDSAVTMNIVNSLKKNPDSTPLDVLSDRELGTIIEKLIEKYSGSFDIATMQNRLKTASINVPIKKLSDDKMLNVDTDIIRELLSYRDIITDDFLTVINANESIKHTIDKEMVDELKDELWKMNLLSKNPSVEYTISKDGWDKRNIREMYIIQPAIKYHHVKEGMRFYAEREYYSRLSEKEKEFLKTRLDEIIKGLMTEQIVVFDTSNVLPTEKYLVTKPKFQYEKALKSNGLIENRHDGEYDMLIYDKQKNAYWGFEIKHTKNPYYKQMDNLLNEDFAQILNQQYGERKEICVLYNGKPFRDVSGIFFLNITDFLVGITHEKNIEKLIADLTDKLHDENLFEEAKSNGISIPEEYEKFLCKPVTKANRCKSITDD